MPSARRATVQLKPEDTAQEATAVADEATQAIKAAAATPAKSFRRAMDWQTQAAVDLARAYQEEAVEANRRLGEAWSSGVRAIWWSPLAAPAAAFAAGCIFMEVAACTSAALARQWGELLAGPPRA
jgi:hypothetical protein